MSDQPWTIGRLLTWTAEFLAGKGSDSARLDAEVLLAHARGCQRIELYAAFDEPADDALREQFRALVQQRAAGKPVAYLVGQREFFSLKFRVTPDVLIPRPETEELVVRALDLAKEMQTERAIEIADVGTGSGVLAVCLAKQLERCRVTALDDSPAALEIARENAEKHGVAKRIEFVESDVFTAVDPTAKFDVVVSNPPYVTTAEYGEVPATVRDYEPRRALEGGGQGTDVIVPLIEQAAQRLRPGGRLLIEISPMIAERVEQLIDATPGLALQPTIRDAADLPRVVEAQAEEAR